LVNIHVLRSVIITYPFGEAKNHSDDIVYWFYKDKAIIVMI